MVWSQNPFYATQAERFLNLGLEVLDTNLSTIKQKFIQELAGERGLQRVVYFVEKEYVLDASNINTLSFWHHCVPFLRLITHTELRTSLVLENSVGTIYNVIYGHSGARAIPFFHAVVNHLSQTAANVDGTPNSFGSAVCATSTAVLMMFNVNQSASVQGDFVGIVQSLRKCITTESSEYEARVADMELRKVEQRLQIAETIPFAEQLQVNTTKDYTSPPQIDLPGDRSQYGHRHDNDKANIAEIRILPTPQEIMATNRTEYLPWRDYNSHVHHLPPGIDRILDTQFRLLREDTSGQLRDAVRLLVHNLATNPDKKLKQPNGTQTIIYKGVALTAFKISGRDGLQLDVTFNQPDRALAMGAQKRRDWWKAVRYLQVGALLCLVSDHNNGFTFLTVTDRKVEANPGTENTQNEIVDLAGHQEKALVTLRLVDASKDLEVILAEYYRQIQLGPADKYVYPYLVEFPGLLFASFEPILRFLQNITSRGMIPFSNLLAPEGNSADAHPTSDPTHDEVIKVPPPLYLTKHRKLNLSSITKGKAPLFHSLANPCTVRDLKRLTTLDPGQCSAFLSALSNELALIQGPPGTGKSYVGVQLVKVLLANNTNLRLGPIICV